MATIHIESSKLPFFEHRDPLGDDRLAITVDDDEATLSELARLRGLANVVFMRCRNKDLRALAGDEIRTVQLHDPTPHLGWSRVSRLSTLLVHWTQGIQWPLNTDNLTVFSVQSLQSEGDLVWEIPNTPRLVKLQLLMSKCASFVGMPALPQLESLHLYRMNGSLSLRGLSKSKALKKLHLEQTKHLGDLDELSELSELTHVVFDRCVNVSGLESLRALRKLESVALIGTRSDRDVLQCVPEGATVLVNGRVVRG